METEAKAYKLRAARFQPPISTIRRTRRLEAPSMAGEQLRLSCPAAAAIVAHLRDDIADRHGAPLCSVMRFSTVGLRAV